jgi:hypothetical protein
MSKLFLSVAITIFLSLNANAVSQIGDSESSEFLPTGTMFVATQDVLIRANTSNFSLCRSTQLYSDKYFPEDMFRVCTEPGDEIAGFCLFKFRPSGGARVLSEGSGWSIGWVKKYESCSGCSWSTELISIRLSNALGKFEDVGVECRISKGRDSYSPNVGQLKTLLRGYFDVVQPEPNKVPVCQ